MLVVLAPAASAHPLGNFSVNTYTGVRIAPDRLTVDHVVDSAEIPTVQHRGELDADGDGSVSDGEATAAAAAAVPRRDRATSPCRSGAVGRAPVDRSALTFPPGQAGLQTTRLECRLTGAAAVTGALPVTVADRSGSGRVGWHEMTAVGDGVTLAGSTVPTASISKRLTGVSRPTGWRPRSTSSGRRSGSARAVTAEPVAARRRSSGPLVGRSHLHRPRHRRGDPLVRQPGGEPGVHPRAGDRRGRHRDLPRLDARPGARATARR